MSAMLSFEVNWSSGSRETLVFRDKLFPGQLVFAYDNERHEWMPFWVIDEEDGLYEVGSAGCDDKRLKGLRAEQLGIAVDKNGKTYQELFGKK